jgi:hypothetical protein
MADETFTFIKDTPEVPSSVQKFEQSEASPTEVAVTPTEEEFAYIAPLKSAGILDYMKEPAEVGKSILSGLAWGPSALLKTATNFVPESEEPRSFKNAILEPAISELDKAVEWWEPKTTAPGRVSNWVRGAGKSIGQSVSAGVTGAAIALTAGPASIPATVIGAILSKGGTFGGAQWYDLTKEIEEEAIKRNASPEEIAIIQKEAASWKAIEAGAEIGGEIIPDIISARIFGLTGNSALKEPIKQGIRTVVARFAKKMGLTQLAEITGEEATTIAQYVGHEKIFEGVKKQPEFWKQIEDTAAITGIQTLVMGAGASAVASTRNRSSEAFVKDFKSKTSAALQDRGVNKDTADTIADVIIKKATKTDAADTAIAELEGRAVSKKATKEEREAKKAKTKAEMADKAKKALQTILAPEPTEKLELVTEEKPTVREEKLAKLKGEERPIYRVSPTPETAIRQPVEEALPKQAVTFIKLAPSVDINTPDVVVEDSAGHATIFNPEIHIMDDANIKAAKRDIEVWSPPAAAPKVETTRERRLRILSEAGRLPRSIKAIAETPTAAETVEMAPTTAEVVAIVRKLRPGLIEHIDAMSKRGWDIDDFINDPDVKADLDGVVPADKYYNLIMDIKEEIGALTSSDVFDKQMRDEQATLGEDIANIDKMKDEDRMQGEPAEYDEYYDPTQQKWIQLEKSEIVSNIENNFVEPPPAVEQVPVVVQVPTETKKIFSKKVVDNGIWYQPKDEAMTQLDLLKQTKLDWSSDIDSVLHALQTQTNVAYHMKDEVPFSSLSNIETNLDYYKQNLTHSEYSRLESMIDSLRRFMVDVSDAIKATDEQVTPQAPTVEFRKEKYNPKVRKALSIELLNLILAVDKPITANSLIDFVRYNKDTFSAAEVVLAEYYSSPTISTILEKVGVVIDYTNVGPLAYYAGKDTTEGKRYMGPIVGFRSDYSDAAVRYNISVGEDIMHEATHALTVEILRSSPTFTAAVKDLRLRAINGLPENDRNLVKSFNESALKFHEKDFSEWGFSKGSDYNGVYYGLLNNEEFIASTFSDPQFQQYLSSISIDIVKDANYRGPTLTLWDKFKELLSLMIFGKSMSERETNLLDAALFVGNKAIETTSQEHFQSLSYEAKERSINASAPRIKSIDVEHALQSQPLKGSGVHAGLGTPIQHNINIIEAPVDITRLAVYAESPLFALRNNPKARAYAEEAIDALGTWSYNRSLGFMEIDRITKELNESEREKVTSILKEIESGEVVNLDTLKPNIKQAVIDTRKFLDAYKNKHKKFLREMLILGSNTTESRILADVLTSNISVTDAIKKWNRYARAQNKARTDPNAPKTATTTYSDILEMLKEWKEIEQFGIKDYITHAMRGSIALVDPGGKVIAFAQTKKKAVEEALRYLTENPHVESIDVDTTYRLDKDFQTLVSQKHYRAMKGKIAKIVNQYAKDIGKDLTEKLKTALPGKGIAIKPQKIWSQFLQEREEELPGERDVFDILPLYVHSIEKTHALDPYIMKMRDHLHEFSETPNIKKLLEDQLQAIRGQYTVGDAIVDDLLNRLGIEKQFAYTQGLAATRTVLTNLKLGYRPIAAIINLLSGMGHTWVKTSAKYMVEANKTIRTEGGRDFIKKNAPSLGTSIIEGMGGDLENRLNWYSPLKLFQAPEIPNRELSFMSSYLFSRGEYGYNEEEAVEFAKRSVDTQQFNYSVAGLPSILRGPGGKTVGQFKAYLIKEIEFIRGLKGANQWAKYLTMQTVLGGPRGFMITLKSLPFLALIGGDKWLDDLDTWLNNNYPRLSRGVFGYFGIDASGPAAFQFPTEARDWPGILISTIIGFGKEVVQPFINEESYLWEDVKKYTKDVIPIWKLWNEFWQGLMNEDGWILDDKGNNKFKVESWTDLVKLIGGFKPLKMSVQELEIRMSSVLEERERAQANKIVEQIVKRSRMIDVDIVTEELVNEVAIHAISPDTIVAAIERSHLDPSTRQLLKAKMVRRMELWQRQLPVREFRGY